MWSAALQRLVTNRPRHQVDRLSATVTPALADFTVATRSAVYFSHGRSFILRRQPKELLRSMYARPLRLASNLR
jgi:hypothetical protein